MNSRRGRDGRRVGADADGLDRAKDARSKGDDTSCKQLMQSISAGTPLLDADECAAKAVALVRSI